MHRQLNSKVRGNILLECCNVPWFGEGFQDIQLFLSTSGFHLFVNGDRQNAKPFAKELDGIAADFSSLDQTSLVSKELNGGFDDFGGYAFTFRSQNTIVQVSEPPSNVQTADSSDQILLSLSHYFAALCNQIHQFRA